MRSVVMVTAEVDSQEPTADSAIGELRFVTVITAGTSKEALRKALFAFGDDGTVTGIKVLNDYDDEVSEAAALAAYFANYKLPV